MLYVDYLSLTDSERLIRRRVIGLPRSFLCFAHCMAGGLPRDLIRACRDMLAAADDDHRDMPAIITVFMTRDLKRKLFAIGTAAKAVKLEPETSVLLERLHDLKDISAQADVLLREYETLSVSLSRLARTGGAPADPMSEAEREKLRSIVAELAAYLYFSATILELFGASAQESRLRDLDASGTVEALARAQQALGLRPRVAATLLSKLRREHQLTTVEYPREENGDAACL
jgi:hypothetical protein